MAGRKRRKQSDLDHEEKYREPSTEEDETVYFDEPAEAPGPSVPAGGKVEHTHVDETAYMDEEPEERPPSAKKTPAEPEEAGDKSPSPGVPNFWASAEIGDDEDWLPSTRNRPSSSPWEEHGKLEEAE